MKYKRHFPQFIEALDGKLQKGFKVYGDVSFERGQEDLLNEIQQECLYFAGWGFVLWVKIEGIKRGLKGDFNYYSKCLKFGGIDIKEARKQCGKSSDEWCRDCVHCQLSIKNQEGKIDKKK